MSNETPQQRHVKKRRREGYRKLQRWVHESVYAKAERYIEQLNRKVKAVD